MKLFQGTSEVIFFCRKSIKKVVVIIKKILDLSDDKYRCTQAAHCLDIITSYKLKKVMNCKQSINQTRNDVRIYLYYVCISHFPLILLFLFGKIDNRRIMDIYKNNMFSTMFSCVWNRSCNIHLYKYIEIFMCC